MKLPGEEEEKKQNALVRCFFFCCPPKAGCAMCCTIFSLWGFIVLFIVGVSLQAGYEKIDNEEVSSSRTSAVGIQCYIAAGIYALFVLGCGLWWGWLQFKKANEIRMKMERRAAAVAMNDDLGLTPSETRTSSVY